MGVNILIRAASVSERIDALADARGSESTGFQRGNMLTIGLTGGIGSGKTTVANLFAEQGVPIIDADDIAREVVLPGEPALQAITQHFGEDILSTDGTLDRRRLRERIFANPNERKWLEDTLHPLIRQRIAQRLTLITAPYCIIVIPLLVETMPYPFLQRILVVDSSQPNQAQRVTTRDQTTATEVESILQAQTTREQRLAAADDVITNEGTPAELAPQVAKLHQKYLSLSRTML